MTVTISTDKISGAPTHLIKTIINLSSCPKNFLPLIMLRLPTLPAGITYKQIIPTMMYNTQTKQFIKQQNRGVAIAVMDEDNKNNDLILRSLKEYTNILIVERIMLKKEKSRTTVASRIGATRYMCNHHHTEEIIAALACTNMPIENTDGIMMINVIQTPGSYLSGVAGLTLYLNHMKLPFVIEQRQTLLADTWLLMTQAKLTRDYDIADVNTVDYNTMKTKKNWSMLMGYSKYITTEKGPKLLVKKNAKKGNFITQVWNWFSAFLTAVYDILCAIAVFLGGESVLKPEAVRKKTNKGTKLYKKGVHDKTAKPNKKSKS